MRKKLCSLVAVGYLKLSDDLLSKLKTNTQEVSKAQHHLTERIKNAQLAPPTASQREQKCEIPQDDIKTEVLSLENHLN